LNLNRRPRPRPPAGRSGPRSPDLGREVRDLGTDLHDAGRDIRNLGRDLHDAGREVRDLGREAVALKAVVREGPGAPVVGAPVDAAAHDGGVE
jgi:hypothetical protein